MRAGYALATLPADTTQQSEEDAARQDQLLYALSSSTRRCMLSLLSRADGTMCVEEVARHFMLAQPTISHHLRLLTAANLVYRERRPRHTGTGGHYVYYYANHERLAEAQNIIASIATRRHYANH